MKEPSYLWTFACTIPTLADASVNDSDSTNQNYRSCLSLYNGQHPIKFVANRRIAASLIVRSSDIAAQLLYGVASQVYWGQNNLETDR